jgi:hypothetical protein
VAERRHESLGGDFEPAYNGGYEVTALPKSLDKLERLLESAFEGTVQRVLRTRLQPVQLARAASRELERRRVVGPTGPVVPNRVRIGLHPRDFADFSRYQRGLERELASYLTNYARERRWGLAGEIAVELIEQADLHRGWPRVEAELVDPEAESAVDQPTDRLPAPTALLPRPGPRPEPLPAARQAFGWLVGAGGERFALVRDSVRIGRDLENDVVLPDSRVSRFHAVAEARAGRVLLRDLGSTNGTRVADRSGQEWELRDGDRVSLGGYLLTFRER